MSFQQIQIQALQMPTNIVPRDMAAYNCRFCLDNHFLFVLPEWVNSGLPAKIERTQILGCLIPKFSNHAIPCDCHPSASKTFRQFFGRPVFATAYGKALVSVRESNSMEEKQ